MPTVIGIDVGGSRKGFHAVALTGGSYADRLATAEVRELVHWCRRCPIGATGQPERRSFFPASDGRLFLHWSADFFGIRIPIFPASGR
jgi:hypothetical protein